MSIILLLYDFVNYRSWCVFPACIEPVLRYNEVL